jgi:hypothetical protein
MMHHYILDGVIPQTKHPLRFQAHVCHGPMVNNSHHSHGDDPHVY